MTKILYKNKNYIAQQILKSLKLTYSNKKKKLKLKYKFVNNKFQKFSLQIYLFLKSCFVFYWLVKQFNLIKFTK